MRRLLLVLVPLLVLAGGAALYVDGQRQQDEADAALTAARQDAADALHAEEAQDGLERRLRAARRHRRELVAQAGDLTTTSDQVLDRSQQVLVIADRMIAALRSRDYDGYNAAIVGAQSNSEARHDAQSVFSGDSAQLNGIVNEVSEALDQG